MKKMFLTGLALLLPITITVWVVLFVINFFSDPFQNIVESILRYFDLLDRPIWVFSEHQVLFLSSKVIVLVLLVGLILFVGMLARLFIGKSLLQVGYLIVQRIPIINKIYSALQDVTNIFFSSKKSAFSQVVLVPFPYKGTYSIGFLTSEEKNRETQEISVFMPCSPNPSFGFILVYHPSEVIFLDIPVEQALKSVVSCGVILPDL